MTQNLLSDELKRALFTTSSDYFEGQELELTPQAQTDTSADGESDSEPAERVPQSNVTPMRIPNLRVIDELLHQLIGKFEILSNAQFISSHHIVSFFGLINRGHV